MVTLRRDDTATGQTYPGNRSEMLYQCFRVSIMYELNGCLIYEWENKFTGLLSCFRIATLPGHRTSAQPSPLPTPCLSFLFFYLVINAHLSDNVHPGVLPNANLDPRFPVGCALYHCDTPSYIEILSHLEWFFSIGWTEVWHGFSSWKYNKIGKKNLQGFASGERPCV